MLQSSPWGRESGTTYQLNNSNNQEDRAGSKTGLNQFPPRGSAGSIVPQTVELEGSWLPLLSCLHVIQMGD